MASLTSVVAVAFVTAIFALMLGLRRGFLSSTEWAGNVRAWILLSLGVSTESVSYITHEQLEILRSLPEITTNAEGHALLSPEITASIDVSHDKRHPQYAVVRGVEPIARFVHSKLAIVQGRWPRRGWSECIVGRALAVRNPYLRIGSRLRFGHHDWSISGTFADADGQRESEVWTDFDDLKTDARAPNMDTNSVHLLLKPGTAALFEAALRSDGRLELRALPEDQYYMVHSTLTRQLRGLGLLVAIAMEIGTTFGAMNLMQAVIARRQYEIGVLRALGFSSTVIALNIVLESACVTLAGGLIGLGLAIGLANLMELKAGVLSIGTLFFSYDLGLRTVNEVILVSLAIGAVAAALPVWRASRLGIIESLAGTAM